MGKETALIIFLAIVFQSCASMAKGENPIPVHQGKCNFIMQND